MAILMMSKYTDHYIDPEVWRAGLLKEIPDLDFRLWPEVGDLSSIDMVLADFAPKGFLKTLPNLKLVSYLGYGVDSLFKDPDLPKVSITRIMNPGIAKQISQYVLLYLLRQHRMLDTYLGYQQEKKWSPAPPSRTQHTTVGILGFGRLGANIADYLVSLGFPVLGWSRTSKWHEGVECYSGNEALPKVLRRSDYVVCALPLTPATQGIINKDTLKYFSKGAYFINVGRGGQLVEKDLVDAIDSGHVSGATLDVFESEPLPENSPLWGHPKVTVTPHVGAFFVDDGIAEAAQNYRRIKSGAPIPDTIDFDLQY